MVYGSTASRAVSARWLYTGWAAYWAALLPVRGPGVVATEDHRAHLFADTSKRRLFGRIRPKSRRRCGVLGCLNLFLAFSAARNSRARVVQKSRRRRVAAGAAVIEMRRIKRYFRYWQREHLVIHRHARGPGARGQPPKCPAERISPVRRPLPARWAAPSVQLCLCCLWLAGIQLSRARRAGLHSEENPAAAIQILCCV